MGVSVAFRARAIGYVAGTKAPPSLGVASLDAGVSVSTMATGGTGSGTQTGFASPHFSERLIRFGFRSQTSSRVCLVHFSVALATLRFPLNSAPVFLFPIVFPPPAPHFYRWRLDRRSSGVSRVVSIEIRGQLRRPGR